jgi:TPR repeat protein
LGNLHLGGRGVPVDYRRAQKWYRKAAAQHSATAVNALGYICEEGGFGISKDLTKAAAYYRQAARAGDGKAQANLGRVYLEGLSVPRDPVEAYKWFSLASTNGGASAGHYMDELAGIARYGDYAGPSLTADQMKEALRRAAEFQACPGNQKP